MDCRDASDADTEWVLLVPSKLTEVVYDALVGVHCVARPWELPGRTGTRIHRHSATHVGIPITWKEKLCALIESETSQRATGGCDYDAGDKTVQHAQYLREVLLNTPGVELVQKPFTPSKSAKIYEEKPFDARVHPERAPSRCNVTIKTTVADSRDSNGSDRRPPAFTYAELFAGIGGFGVALERLGGKCVFCSELEESCRRIYSMNFPHTSQLLGDILEVPDEDLPQAGELDLLVAGFPCQPFSALGDQPGLSCPTKGNLFLQIVRVLRVSQPQAFLLENVPGLLSMSKDLNIILSALEEAGYAVKIEVCNARALTAGTRKRLYFAGLRKQRIHTSFEFPYIPDLGLRARDVLNYAENDENNSLRVNDDQFARLRQERHWRPAHLAWPNTVCATLVSHYGNAIAQGNSQLVPCPSGNPRRFTPRECARIMGFPSSYQLPDQPREHQGAMAFVKEQYRMFGNAVCPPIIAALAGALLSHCRSMVGYQSQEDWVDWGRRCAVDLAVRATISGKLEAM